MRSGVPFRALVLAAMMGVFGAARPQSAGAQSADKWMASVGITINTALGRRESTWGPGGTVAILRRSGRFAFGVEAGYQEFGTEVTRIDDFDNQPGWVYREEFERSMLRLAALVRADAGSGRVRPYAVAGGGAYDGRFEDRIEVRDANGERVPFYDFEGSGSDVKPGITAGLGLGLRRAAGRLGIALEARWHGILDVTEDGFGTADFFSFGLALTW